MPPGATSYFHAISGSLNFEPGSLNRRSYASRGVSAMLIGSQRVCWRP